MTEYTVAVIGTGPDPDEPVSGESFAMGYRHAASYERLDDCTLSACADVVRDRAEAFAEEFDLDADHVFDSYETMLAEVRPDIVSVTVPPKHHADIVVDCATSGCVRAIHCEKPMAATWGGAQRMASTCDAHGVQLTINHQHRYGEHVRTAKELLEAGRIGRLQRVAFGWGDFFDNGTHAIDMLNYFNGDRAPEWVLAGLDYREENVRYGVHTENQMLALWQYENGVHGMAATGPGGDAIGNVTRLTGTDGVIEIDFGEGDGPPVRFTEHGDDEWTSFDDVSVYSPSHLDRAIEDSVAAIGEDRDPRISARRALRATEIIFAGYESVRRRGRVDCPLDVRDHPLEALVDAGDIELQ